MATQKETGSKVGVHGSLIRYGLRVREADREIKNYKVYGDSYGTVVLVGSGNGNGITVVSQALPAREGLDNIVTAADITKRTHEQFDRYLNLQKSGKLPLPPAWRRYGEKHAAEILIYSMTRSSQNSSDTGILGKAS